MKTHFRVLLVLLFIPFLAGCKSTESTRAMHDWEPGVTVEYEIVQTNEQSIEIPGQGFQEQQSSSTMNLTVTSEAPQRFSVHFTDASSVGGQTSIQPLIGQEGTIVLDASGNVIESIGLAENAFIAASGGEEVFRYNLLQLLFLVLPEEPLAQGVEWTRDSSISYSQQGLNIEWGGTDTYTVVQQTMYEGAPALEISVSSVVSIKGSGSQGGQAMDVALGGTTKGTMYVDPVAGFVLSSESDGTLEGVIEVSGGVLPMSMVTSTTAKATLPVE